MKYKIHKLSYIMRPVERDAINLCGLYSDKPILTDNWKLVTCKMCLKSKVK
jgi:hypothetical protein